MLIDKSDDFVFGFSKLEVMFGRAPAEQVRHPYRDFVKPGVQFVQSTIRAIDPDTQARRDRRRHVRRRHPRRRARRRSAPRGDAGTRRGRLRVLHRAPARSRCATCWPTSTAGASIVAVTSTPFKCPPAPSETALLMHDFLTDRGLRDRSHISLVMPLPVPIPPSPDASKALLAAFAERGIDWHPQTLVRGLDPARQVAMLGDGAEMPYDLFLGVPTHRVPEVVAQSGMTVDGWIPVDPMTLETQFPGVYAVGDVTSVGTPKAGVFAEGQAAVAADGISARHPRRGRVGALRRARHLLPRVRPRPGRQGRRHVRERAGAARHARRPVARARRRQGRVRHQSRAALVRAHLALSAASIRPSRTR